MDVEREISDETHRVLSEEVDGYDPEVEADGGSERPTD